MGTWNYRVVKHTPETGHTYYAVHEVYYSDDGSIVGRTENAVWPVGDTVEELRSDINRILASLGRPILDAND